MKDKTQEFGRDAMNKIEENRVSAAGALHNAASTMHQNADKLPNGPDIAHSAADRVEAVASYLQGHDTKQMMADMETVVQEKSGAFAAGGGSSRLSHWPGISQQQLEVKQYESQ